MTRPNRPETRPPGTTAGLLTVSLGLVVAALPTFLVGGLAVQIRDELGFTEAALGAAVTGAFFMGAVTAPAVGPLTDRIGARASIASGTALSALSLVGIAGFAGTWAQLAGLLLVAGVGIAFTDPGLAVLVTRTVPRERHGFAFGLKEASIPLATLASGLAVPAVALTVGWRWAFALGLLPLAVLLTLVSRLRIDEPRGSSSDSASPLATGPPRGAVLVVAAAAALGSAAASGVAVFLTESGVAMGMTPAAAGFLLAAGSLAGIVTRLATGIWADRRGGPQLGLMSWMLVGGAVTMAIGSFGTPLLVVVGAVGAFSGGWGWSGLLFLSLVRSSPTAPGAVAGIGMSGLAIGNAAGPLGFGLVAQHWSYPAAWLTAAAAAAVAAVVVRSVRHHL